MLLISFVISLVWFSVAFAYSDPPLTFEAKDFTSWGKRVEGMSRRASIHVPFTGSDGSSDFVSGIRLDLVGDAKARGFAHGALLTKEIVEFTGPKLDKFFADEVLNLDISQFPEPIHSVLSALQKIGAAVAPKLFHAAMEWVWQKEAQYVPQVILDEMDGMAEGICHTLGGDCDVNEWAQKVRQFNMLPELIRMACTAYGAWGKATPSHGLVQVRALDFGGGPFANYTVISVHREDPNNLNHAFVSVSFPAFVGVVTGIAQSGIGLSQKVWMTYDKRSMQPGSYNGLADVFVLRHILEFSKSREDAEAYLEDVTRTWGIWIGIGDFKSQKFDLVAYKEASSVVYTDVTAPAMTGQPYLESVAYVDKHPQPSGEGPTGTLPTALTDFYGNITTANSKIITQYHKTGDLHIASYDFVNKHMLVSWGRINHEGNYYPEGASDHSQWMAYNRPYVKFDLDDLWSGR